MAETNVLNAPDSERTRSEPPATEQKTFRDVLLSVVGKPVTVATSESYEDAPVGHQLRTAFYRARPVSVGRDMLVLRTERKKKGAHEAEPVKQVIPFSSIKRLSMMRSELVLHL